MLLSNTGKLLSSEGQNLYSLCIFPFPFHCHEKEGVKQYTANILYTAHADEHKIIAEKSFTQTHRIQNEICPPIPQIYIHTVVVY